MSRDWYCSTVTPPSGAGRTHTARTEARSISGLAAAAGGRERHWFQWRARRTLAEFPSLDRNAPVNAVLVFTARLGELTAAQSRVLDLRSRLADSVI